MIERRTGNGTEKDRLPLREVQRESTLKKVNWQRARVLGYHEQRESERRCLLREEGMERELQFLCVLAGSWTKYLKCSRKAGEEGEQGGVEKLHHPLQERDGEAGPDCTDPQFFPWRQGNVIMIVSQTKGRLTFLPEGEQV